jgi:hypothetical protein
MRTKILILALLFFFALGSTAPRAALLDGYYEVSSLVFTYNDSAKHGFNNTALYIMASGKRVRLVGAWRGYPIMRDATVEKNTGDSITLRDAQDTRSVYKFRVKNNTISGRHSITDEDGSRQIIDSKAVLRQLSPSETDRIRIIFGLP